MRPYAELCCRSAFSFGEGASQPEELVERAAALGLHSLAITDRDGVYGLPRAWKAALQHGLRLVCGALLTLSEGPGLVALVRDHPGWTRLCHLLTRSRCGGELDDACVGNAAQRRARRIVKGRGQLDLDELLADCRGLHLVAMGDWSPPRLRRLREAAGEQASLGLSRTLHSLDGPRVRARMQLSAQTGLPLLATNDVRMHDPGRQPLQDVLTCIRLRCTLAEAGTALDPNAERHLLSPAAMWARFGGPDGPLAPALDRGVQIAEACGFTLGQLHYRYPREVVPDGLSPMEGLRRLVAQGAAEHYPHGVPPKVQAQLDHELDLIARMDFPAYFLTVHDAVRFARARGILCQGRGSAANSAVCYVLGITSVDPASSSLLFERFISEERGEPPDIDVDFEHERREEVFRYIYGKYGRQRAAMVNEVICWRRRSAVREVGRVLGLSGDQADSLARQIHWFDRGAVRDDQLRQAGLDPADPATRRAVELAGQMSGLPRHTGIHVGGFTISDTPLVDLCPVEPATMEGRTVIQWDKDDIDIVGFIKVDLLSLGMLTAIRKAFELIEGVSGQRLDLARVPAEDPAVYEMIGKADTVGVFQIESRAQMSMLPRLKPRCWYDLVIEVSVVRPGPIQGGMVHPYLRRRMGLEPVEYAHEKLRPILERTLGVPIFQEQVMAMAVAVGGFSPGKADALRRAMGAWRKRGGLLQMSQELIEGMRAQGIPQDYAEQVAAQIQGFGEYGFPESHAASFARLVYVSAWLKRHHPAAFAAALVNSWPMGFYAPRALLADAQRHGVRLLPVDVRCSGWDLRLEAQPDAPDGPAIRLGLRLIKGFAEESARRIEAARAREPFRDLGDLQVRAGLRRDELLRLARADALRGLGLEGAALPRRQAVWESQGLVDLPLFRGLLRQDAEPPAFPAQAEEDALIQDYESLGLSIERHPIGLLREELRRRGLLDIATTLGGRDRQRVRVAGLISHRQRPGTASGIVFMTLEDETGLLNVVVKPSLFERQRALILEEPMVELHGLLQRDGDSVSLLALHLRPLRRAPAVQPRSRDFH